MQRRLLVVTIVGLAVVTAAVTLGGIPLFAGLLTVGVLATAILPDTSRNYLLRRLVRSVGTILTALAVIWLLVYNFPDQSRLDEPGVVPAMVRYVEWLADAIMGDLGGATSYSETVGEGLSRTIPISAQLLIYSQLLALAVAVPGAVVGARFRGRGIDVGLRTLSFFGLAMPMIITGLLLAQLLGVGDIDIFGLSFGVSLFPVGRYTPLGAGLGPHLASMALPSITLALTSAATYLVLLRSELVQQLSQDHVLLARSKGLRPGRIVTRHALRPAAPSAVAAVAAHSGLALGYVVIIERIFLLPGFGDYVLVAIGRRDEMAVVGALFVAAVILAAINLFADALLLMIDPRLTP